MDTTGSAGNRIERSEAAPLIADLLSKIPDRWSGVDVDTLSDAESRVLYWMTAAGLVERRVSVRVGAAGATARIEATLTATGEFGWHDAMGPVCAEFTARFGSAIPVCETLTSEQWRLTADGCKARTESQNGDQFVVDFVLKDSLPMMVRPPVRGTGKMLRMEFRDGEGTDDGVRVANWAEGAAIFAEVLRPAEAEPPVATGIDEKLIKLLAYFGDDASRVHEIARSAAGTDDRMRRIYAIYPDVLKAWDSEDWAALLNVKSGTVRGTSLWLSRKEIEDD